MKTKGAFDLTHYGHMNALRQAKDLGGFLVVGVNSSATVAENMFSILKGPVKRLGAPRAPVSYSPPLEDQVRVTSNHISAAIRAMQ